MAHQFFAAHLATAVEGEIVEVTGAEAKHAVSVSRVRPGESLALSDGAGTRVLGTVQVAAPALLTVRVAAVQRVPVPAPRLGLVQALAKGDRDERAVQAAVELGAMDIVPWAATRSVSRWDGPKASKGQERWQAIADEAAKQSLRAWKASVSAVHATKRLTALADTVRLLVLHPEADTPLSQLELDERDCWVVVGPEGGVSPEELAAFIAAGAETVRLGAEVLRTSTAGPAALAVLNARLGRW